MLTFFLLLPNGTHKPPQIICAHTWCFLFAPLHSIKCRFRKATAAGWIKGTAMRVKREKKPWENRLRFGNIVVVVQPHQNSWSERQQHLCPSTHTLDIKSNLFDWKTCTQRVVASAFAHLLAHLLHSLTRQIHKYTHTLTPTASQPMDYRLHMSGRRERRSGVVIRNVDVKTVEYEI